MLESTIRHIAIVSLIVILVLPSVLACSTGQTTPSPEVQAQTLVERFSESASADDRIKCLAGLLKLPGQEQTVRGLFDALSQPDKLALFTLDDPYAVGTELVAVVKILYADLPNDTDSNALLHAMDRPLTTLEGPAARSLSVEIERWLQGRESYNQGQDAEAVVAYNEAIQLNPRNPGTCLDRALAYARLNETNLALDDLVKVVSLNSGQAWNERLRQVLLGNQGLYNAMWSQKEKYSTLVAFVPTPTHTPTPTTPAPSPTPISPTRTNTPALPTPTNTPTVTPIVTATATLVIPPRLISPLSQKICSNPVTFR